GQQRAAAEAWAAFSADRRYRVSDWIFNGSFESAPAHTGLDWSILGDGEHVLATIDGTVAHGGVRSLKLTFGGKANVEYERTYQSTWIEPGRYQLEAFVKTSALTTNEGVRFVLAGPPLHGPVESEDIRGSHDWTKIVQPIETTSPGLL